MSPTGQTPLRAGISTRLRYHLNIHGWRQEPSEVVVETPFTFFVNGREFVTVVVTPTDLRDLAMGFLASEGVIRSPQDVTVMHIREDDQQIWVRIPGLDPRSLDRFGKRSLGSCCGRSRPSLYLLTDEDTTPSLGEVAGPPLDPDRIIGWFEELNAWARSQNSGGLHVAGLAGIQGMSVMRADVGRHNALDKLYGHCLAHAISANAGIILFSGRISSEIVLKVAKIGSPVIVSNAAPTSLGLDLAESLGITAIGFLRQDELSVYTHPERLVPLNGHSLSPEVHNP